MCLRTRDLENNYSQCKGPTDKKSVIKRLRNRLASSKGRLTDSVIHFYYTTSITQKFVHPAYSGYFSSF